MSRNSQKLTTNGATIELERVFDAPRELVFKAWTEPAHLLKWWGPREWPLVVCNIDLRVGGDWHYCMKGPNGEEAWGKAIYREIVAPERLAYVDGFSDAEGNVNNSLPEGVTTIDFIEQGNQTHVVARTVYPNAEAVKAVLDMGMEEGLSQAWDQLDELLDTLQPVR